MQNKPIRRSTSLVPLSREHHHSLLFCWKLRRGVKLKVDAKRVINYIAYFYEEILLPHFEEEENILFVLEKDALTQRAKQEHFNIKILAQKILSATENIEYAVFQQLANLIDQHIRFEERELFSHIETYLSKEQLEKTGEHLSKSPVLNDEYEDHFWE